MKHSIKGALLSGLVFPGSGQIALKRYLRGIVLMLTVFTSMSVIVMKAVEQAFTILDRIDIEGGAVDINAITDAATQASSSSGDLIFNIAMLLIVVCWVFAIVDAYIIGKEMDANQDSENH